MVLFYIGVSHEVCKSWYEALRALVLLNKFIEMNMKTIIASYTMIGQCWCLIFGAIMKLFFIIISVKRYNEVILYLMEDVIPLDKSCKLYYL